MIPSFFNQDISDPREIESQGQSVTDDAIAKKWIVATTAEEHIRRVREFVKAGFNHLELLSSSPDECKFIEFYGREVLPHLKE